MMYTLSHTTSTEIIKTSDNKYRIAGKFGEDFNLAVW